VLLRQQILPLSGLLTIDGIVLVANDRVLVKDQTASQNNGIYIASAELG
jgi:phage-related tail fiber protein